MRNVNRIDWIESYRRARRVAWEKLCGSRPGTGGYALPYEDPRHDTHARIMAKLISGVRRAIDRANAKAA